MAREDGVRLREGDDARLVLAAALELEALDGERGPEAGDEGVAACARRLEGEREAVLVLLASDRAAQDDISLDRAGQTGGDEHLLAGAQGRQLGGLTSSSPAGSSTTGLTSETPKVVSRMERAASSARWPGTYGM